jgi:hypothetical protein
MSFTRHGDTIDMVGPIEPGDSLRFHEFLDAILDPENITTFALNSPGGVILEALDMADDLGTVHRITFVPDKGTCASACFYLFAAGERRMVAATARVGVHGAYNPRTGKDASDTTIAMAKREHLLNNIPDRIVVKMVLTPSNDISWLDRVDLAAMNVEVIEPKARTASTPPAASGGGGSR